MSESLGLGIFGFNIKSLDDESKTQTIIIRFPLTVQRKFIRFFNPQNEKINKIEAWKIAI